MEAKNTRLSHASSYHPQSSPYFQKQVNSIQNPPKNTPTQSEIFQQTQARLYLRNAITYLPKQLEQINTNPKTIKINKNPKTIHNLLMIARSIAKDLSQINQLQFKVNFLLLFFVPIVI